MTTPHRQYGTLDGCHSTSVTLPPPTHANNAIYVHEYTSHQHGPTNNNTILIEINKPRIKTTDINRSMKFTTNPTNQANTSTS
eukprot:11031614-Lingulodinium_polyedra.AAC.1